MSYTELSLLEFQRRFSTEAACQEALEQARWPGGFVCPRCGQGEASRITTRRLLQCCVCRYQVSVTAGTVFHKTRTPLVKLFWALWMVSRDKGGTSAMRLSRQMGLSYRTARTMLHKLRKAMGQRDARYTLTGPIEMDDAYFGGKGNGKMGRGTAKTPVVVMVEERGEHAGYIGINALTAASKPQLSAAAQEKIAPGRLVHTYCWTGCNGLAALGHDHHAEKVPPHQAHEKLPWVHIAISNAKTFLLGTYHGVSHKYLQTYLDEFCYRFNRRTWETTLTERLITACSVAKPVTLAELKA
jgi:transposase-like protein